VNQITEINVRPSRNFGLDLFRAVAILFVVISHGGFLLTDTLFDGFPYFRMVDGVDLFFVLSGFLIGGILLKEINKPKFGIPELRTFWIRRWLRTLPNYYLVLGLNYMVVRYGVIIEDITQFSWKFFFFLHNFSKPFYGFFWESWSLSIEEWFYLLTPVALSLLLLKLKPKFAFLTVIFLMIATAIISRLHRVDLQMDAFWYDVTFRKLVLTRLDSIAFGLFAAWVYFYYHHFWKKYRWIALATGLILLNMVVNDTSDVNSFYKKVIYLSFTSFAIMFLLPAAESWHHAKGWIARCVGHISKISYSMYLLNLALVAEVIRDNFPPVSPADSLLKYAAFWVVLIVASSMLYKYFEKPFMDLRERFGPK
jgi:peptidoglycan/LPS O-acetylase OafA/YrhL